MVTRFLIVGGGPGGVSDADARGVVRLSLGHTTTTADLERVSAVLPDVVARARAAAAYV